MLGSTRRYEKLGLCATKPFRVSNQNSENSTEFFTNEDSIALDAVTTSSENLCCNNNNNEYANAEESVEDEVEEEMKREIEEDN